MKTPRSGGLCVVRTVVEVLAPHKGRVHDPCCGSGGMLVQNEKLCGGAGMKKKALRARGAELPAVLGQRGEYASLLRDVKERIQRAQVRAVLSVNAELVRLHWDIGRIIHERQQREGWGAGVIPRLAAELKNELPDLKGFSARNIDRMLSFHRDYPDPAAIVQQPAAQLPAIPISPQPVSKIRTAPLSQPPVAKIEDIAILQPPAGELPPPAEVPQPAALLPGSLLWSVPWAHHVILMQKVKDLAIRQWYMEQTLAGGWSRNMLVIQIDAEAHERQGKAVSNFAAALPASQSDLAVQALKDPYIFDFLTLTEPVPDEQPGAGGVCVERDRQADWGVELPTDAGVAGQFEVGLADGGGDRSGTSDGGSEGGEGETGGQASGEEEARESEATTFGGGRLMRRLVGELDEQFAERSGLAVNIEIMRAQVAPSGGWRRCSLRVFGVGTYTAAHGLDSSKGWFGGQRLLCAVWPGS